MSQFFTLLTKTGQGLLANAIAYGQPLTIATMAIGDGGGKLPTPDASVTHLINEVRRGPINQTTTDPNNPNWTVVEQVLPPDVGGWTIREVGLYDTDGNLIAYGNYPETYKPQLSEGSSRTQTIRFIMEVTDTSAVTLRIDPSVVMASREYVDKSIEAHAKSRNHPYADTTNQGMVKFATLTAAKTGTDTKTALTPAGGMAQIAAHRTEEEAHTADLIVLAETLRLFGGAANVQSVLALLGDAALKTVGEHDGELMAVGAHGWGGKSRPTATTNIDRLCERSAIYTLANQYTNGPGGTASQTYTGQLVVIRREYDAGASVIQIAYINGSPGSGRWERQSDGWDGATNLPIFGAWQKTASTSDITSAISGLGLGSASKKNTSDFAAPGDIPKEAGYDQAVAMSDRSTFLSPFRLASAFTGSNRNFGSNGYQILPSGLIHQWGTHDVDTFETFAISFPNSCRSVVLTDYGELNTGNLSVYSTSTSGFRIRAEVPTAGICYYMAIGY